MPLGAVRELIPRLEAEGLLRTVPQRGLQIAHVDLALINNAFQLRLLLEREAAVRFCTTVSDADLAAIEDAHLRIVAPRSPAGRIDAALLTDAQTVDWGLHDLMIDALGNALISETYRVNSLRVRLIRLERAMLSDDALLPAMEEHLWFIEALKRRDAAAGGRAPGAPHRQRAPPRARPAAARRLPSADKDLACMTHPSPACTASGPR